LLYVLFAGCSITAASDFPVLAQVEKNARAAKPRAGGGLFYVMRSSRFGAGALTALVKINGHEFAHLGNSQWAAGTLPAGSNMIALYRHSSNGNSLQHERLMRINAGEVLYFDVDLNQYDKDAITRMDPEDGREFVENEEMAYFCLDVRNAIYPGLPNVKKGMSTAELLKVLPSLTHIEPDIEQGSSQSKPTKIYKTVWFDIACDPLTETVTSITMR